MELNQLLKAGGDPKAPPGIKGCGAPPPKAEEFHKALQKAEKTPTEKPKETKNPREAKNAGEVAEKEPNVQLQDLDPQQEAKEEETTKDSTPCQSNLSDMAVAALQAVYTQTAPSQVVASDETGMATNSEKNLGAQVPLTSSLRGNIRKIVPLPKVEMPPVDEIEEAVEGESFKLEDNIRPIQDRPMGLKNMDFPVATPMDDDAYTELGITEIKGHTDVIDPKSPQDLNVKIAAGLLKDVPNKVEPKSETNTVSVDTVVNSAEIVMERTSANSGGSSESGQFGNSKQDLDALEDVSSQTELKIGDSDIEAKPVFAQAEVKVSTPLEVATSRLSVDRTKVIDQITRKIESMSANSVRNEVRMQMEPAELGSIVINIRKNLEGLEASLTASHESVRTALHETRNELAASLNAKGFAQVRIQVNATDASAMNSDFGQPSQNPFSGFNQSNSRQHTPSSQTNAYSTPEPEVAKAVVRERYTTSNLDVAI